MDRRLVALVAAAVTVLALPAMAQDAAPAFAPLDPASCASQDGHTAVYIDYIKAWNAAKDDGRLAPDQAQKLAEWLVAMDNWMIESNQTKVHCEQLIAVRKQNGF